MSLPTTSLTFQPAFVAYAEATDICGRVQKYVFVNIEGHDGVLVGALDGKMVDPTEHIGTSERLTNAAREALDLAKSGNIRAIAETKSVAALHKQADSLAQSTQNFLREFGSSLSVALQVQASEVLAQCARVTETTVLSEVLAETKKATELFNALAEANTKEVYANILAETLDLLKKSGLDKNEYLVREAYSMTNTPYPEDAKDSTGEDEQGSPTLDDINQ